MTALPGASTQAHRRRPYSDHYPIQHRHFPPLKSAACTFGRVLWSDESETSETIYEDVSPAMEDQHELFQPRGIRPSNHRMTNGMQQPYAHLHPSQVQNPRQYSSMAQGYAAQRIYETEHANARYSINNDGLRGVGNDMAPEVAYVCSPQGGCPSMPRRASYVLDPNGFPCGTLACTPTTASHPPTSNLSWIYPPTTPTTFPYPANLPCISPTSLYPMVYPQPMFFRVVPPRMSPTVSYGATQREGGHRPEQPLHPTLTSPLPNGNEKQQVYRNEKVVVRERNGRVIEKTASVRNSTLHSVSATAFDEFAAHPKVSCLNDRILSKFKTSKGEQFKIHDIRGHLLAFCLDQAGSRFIQEQLAISNLHETDLVHEELAPSALTLMRDVFGNYIIQILLQNGSAPYRYALAKILMENTLTLTLHVYGCRVIQKALEVLDLDLRLEIIHNLDSHVTRCIKDMNGNHVIQKAIREFNLDEIPFIVKAVHDRVLSFSVHPYGCRVVQRILERECSSREQDIVREKIMSTVAENIGEISQDLYGNYVAQHVLRFSSKPLREKAIEALMVAPVDYACHKYASNVLEQALLYSDQEQRQKMVRTIVSTPRRGDGGDALCMLTTNRFGNYVVQRMLDVVEDDLKCLIVRSIGQRMKSLKKFKYGKHIVSRVERMLSRPPSDDGISSEGDSSASSVA